MKKVLITISMISCLAFGACRGNNNPEATDSDTSKNTDTTNSGGSASSAESSTAPAKGASSSAAIGGFDTARMKLDTANTNPKN